MSDIVGDDMFLVWCLLPSPFMLVYIWKWKWSQDVKQRREKNIQNKAVQSKLNFYIKKYMKKETLQIF